MDKRIILGGAFFLILAVSGVARADEPIVAIEKIQPTAAVFDAATRKAPVAIRAEKEAAEFFSEDNLAKLKEQVDFENQVVLVFAWRGSGQDKLEYAVAESSPEQIKFTLTPGRTRDLRPHIRVFVLRADVKWSLR